MGIPVIFENPRISDVKKWDGAFISSTSRMLMPIDVLRVMNPDLESKEVVEEFSFKKCDILQKLSEHLHETIKKSATPVFDE
jgi:branched-subunit amino acid aminotransferase/4-amino-4-deoxychorismate lyase